MTRTNIYDYPATDDGPTLAGWFDPASAEAFNEATRWDGNNHISLVTGSQWDHQTLYRTKGGRWVLHSWSQWQGSTPTHAFVTDDQAREWLLVNELDDAVTKHLKHFGEVESERGPGRPEIGPAINIRLPESLLDRVDAHAEEQGMTRAAVIRALLAAHLSES
jgi:predicted DNA binding CopG/RHH family protein